MLTWKCWGSPISSYKTSWMTPHEPKIRRASILSVTPPYLQFAQPSSNLCSWKKYGMWWTKKSNRKLNQKIVNMYLYMSLEQGVNKEAFVQSPIAQFLYWVYAFWCKKWSPDSILWFHWLSHKQGISINLAVNGDEVQVFVYRHTYALVGYYLDVDGQEVALYLALC